MSVVVSGSAVVVVEGVSEMVVILVVVVIGLFVDVVTIVVVVEGQGVVIVEGVGLPQGAFVTISLLQARHGHNPSILTFPHV